MVYAKPLDIFLHLRLELGLNSVITSYVLLNITKLSNYNMGMMELYISSYLDWVNRNT